MPLFGWRNAWLKFFFPEFIWKGEEKNTLYLTFDDGPHPEATTKVLEILALYKVKATFFCIGKNAEQFPELIEKILTLGHKIGNHTQEHEKGWRTKKSVYFNSILLANAHLKSQLFRPPYGQIKFSLIDSLKKRGYKIIMWSWLSRDYNPRISNDKIIRAANKIKSGDILVFHDNEKTNARIELLLHQIIPKLLAKQFTFSTFDAYETK
jgi:peptidoglycan/xylan/chitin deacetylase (PgdA/CDA1 family)